VTVQRFEPVFCANGHRLNRAVIREQLAEGREYAFCAQCGDRVKLPRHDAPIALTEGQKREVRSEQRVAALRSRFEQAIFRLKSFVDQEGVAVPECFISYAWGDPTQERWVEHFLANDLLKAGVTILLDRWENARIGASVPRFVERIARADRVIVVGTPRYLEKYENGEPMGGFVVAAEGDLIGQRMLRTERDKRDILPVLLAGTAETSLPPLLQPRVHGDFRNEQDYFVAAFDLMTSVYDLPSQHDVIRELRESLTPVAGAP
jgi:hypothetical protein